MFPGPAALGRGAVVSAGQSVPDAFAGVPRVCVDDSVLAAPGDTVARLHAHWVQRRPVVVELAVDLRDLSEPEVQRRPPFLLAPEWEPLRERLSFLVWANNWDLRGPDPIWWRARKAVRLGAVEHQGEGDVIVEGVPVWCDGGPRGLPDVPEPVLHRESIEAGRLETVVTNAVPPPRAALAPDQLAAVTHESGAARVVAPAGSGKTRVLTERLRHLLVDRRVERQIVTAVAYNKKAAAELRERCAGVDPHVRTIHSLGLWVVRQVENPHVLDETEARRLLDPLVDVPRRRNQDVLAPWLEALAEVRIGLVAPEEVEARRDDVPGFAAVHDRYRAALRARGAVDFDEQIHRALELLLEDPNLRMHVQARGRHLLVDEFQDVTPAHLLLLRLVAGPPQQVFAVGDDDQVVYGYAGATPRFLVGFDDLFPGASHYALEVNHRSPPAVVSSATTLLARNRVRVPKQIRPAPGAQDGPAAFEISRLPAEGLAVAAAERVRTLVSDGVDPADLAILARVNSALLPVVAACVEAGIPIQSPLDTGILARTGTRAVLAWLRVATGTDHIRGDDLVETLRRPSRKLRQPFLKRLSARREWRLGALADLADRSIDRDGDRLAEWVADVRSLSGTAEAKGTVAALITIRDRIGLGGALDTLDSSRSVADRSTHGDDLDALLAAAALHPEASDFEPWLRSVLSKRPLGAAVTASTVHRVKGREWDHVVVYGVHDGLMPHRLSEDVEEERRVLHVAITRCRMSALLLSDAGRTARFIDDLEGRTPTAAEREQAARAAGPARSTKGPGDHGVDDDAGSEMDEAVASALRDWRKERADRDGVPAYTLLWNTHIDGIARRKPRTRTDLLQCPGIGRKRLDDFGDELLALVAGASTSAE